MRRLRWGTIAALSLAFAAGLAAALMLSLRHAMRDRPELSALAFPEDAPFDLGDLQARSAFKEFTMFGTEERIDEQCDKGSGEVYRVEIIAAMDAHPDLALVDVIARGNRATVEVKTFVGGPSRWRTVDRREVGYRDIDVVRDRATRLLAARIPISGDRPIDSGEWTVQMCRRGRYHFFQRYGPRRDAPDDAPFVGFTDAVMALRRGTDNPDS
jgi:hypothetical protein